MKLNRPVCHLVTLTLLGLFAAGCGPARKDEARSDPPATPKPKELSKDVPTGDADLLQGLAVGKSEPVSEADKAWEKLMGAMQPPPLPPEWETNQPSKDAMAAYQRTNADLAFQTAAKARNFYTHYPTNQHADEAHEQERFLLAAAMQLGNTNAAPLLQAIEDARLKDPNLPEDERFQLRAEQLQRSITQRKDEEPAKLLVTVEKEVRALQKDFPNRPEVAGLLLGIAQGWLENNQPDKTKALAQEAADTSPDPETKAAAEMILKRMSRLGQPLDLKFKAVDGREVDVQGLKGKVVLVDFWATWCVPCMAELPNVKAAYEKLHAKGFDIIGISFDREKADLDRILAREKIPWPQAFDENDPGNKLGEQFGIESIPTMWLIDKKGILRDLNARANLEEKVEKLLAE